MRFELNEWSQLSAIGSQPSAHGVDYLDDHVAAFETDSTTFAQIFDADGAALIIHAGPDNLANIPARYSANGVAGPDAATLATGDSGGRFACGVITK